MAKAKYTSEYKARLVLEVLKEESTPSEIAAREGINKNQLQNWKKEFIENASKVKFRTLKNSPKPHKQRN